MTAVNMDAKWVMAVQAAVGVLEEAGIRAYVTKIWGSDSMVIVMPMEEERASAGLLVGSSPGQEEEVCDE